MKNSVCQSTSGTRGFGISKIGRPCKYHRKLSIFSKDRLTPQELCPEAYHSLYPYAFAMLYSGRSSKIKEVLELGCPNADGGVIFSCEKLPHESLKQKIIFILKKNAYFIFPSVDVVNGRIEFTIKKVLSFCPKGHQVGDKFKFNIGEGNDICPAAFNSFYLIESGRYNCPNNNISLKIRCPDYEKNIIFSMENGIDK